VTLDSGKITCELGDKDAIDGILSPYSALVDFFRFIHAGPKD
jgi:hypothetical protein